MLIYVNGDDDERCITAITCIATKRTWISKIRSIMWSILWQIQSTRVSCLNLLMLSSFHKTNTAAIQSITPMRTVHYSQLFLQYTIVYVPSVLQLGICTHLLTYAELVTHLPTALYTVAPGIYIIKPKLCVLIWFSR